MDTHATTHTLALVAAATGAVLDHAVFPTNTVGLSRAHGWLTRRVGDQRTLVVAEGTGSYGTIVTERWQAAGLTVFEAAKMAAGDRRGTGKSDELDAVRIARAVLGLPLTGLRAPRELSTEHARVAMGVLVGAREQMSGERTRTINALTALVRTIDLGIDARKPLTGGQITTITAWRDRDLPRDAVRLARHIRTRAADLAGHRADITTLIDQDTPRNCSI